MLARVTTVVAFVLLVAGSLVHQTGSSLACPDWPLCNGTAFPMMRGGVAFEHTHRLIALALVVLIATLVIRARNDPDRDGRRATMACAVLVVVQAALGATTVLLRLPPTVSIAHLATAMTLLGTLGWISARAGPPAPAGLPSFRAAAGLVILQCLLGALVRHRGAALACYGFPACSGSFWPDGPLARLHMLHRAVAVVLLVHLAIVAARGARSSKLVATAPLALALVQVGLGVAVVLTGTRQELITLHHATGAAIALAVGFALGKRRASHDRGHDDSRVSTLRNEGDAKLDAT